MTADQPPPDDGERTWTPEELGDAMRLDARTIIRWAALGKLPHTRGARGRVIISDAVAQAVIRGEEPPNEPGTV